MSALAFDLPDEQQVSEAQAAVDILRRVTSSHASRVRLAIDDPASEVEVTLPRETLHLLMRILTHMASGHAVTIMPVEAELTTQQAADLLGVSRPFLVKLLDEGTIPHHKVGTHRRVRAVDLMAYKRRDDAARRRAADALTAEAEALGLGY